MLGATRKYPSLQRFAVVTVLAASVSLGAGSSRAQQLTVRSDHQQQDAFPRSAAKHAATLVPTGATHCSFFILTSSF